MRHRLGAWLFAFLCGALMVAAPAAEAAEPGAPAPLFASSTPLNLVLEAPLSGLLRNRSSDNPVAGVLIDDAGNRLPVRVALRGITRRTESICAFPPLSIRFDSPPPATSSFAGQKKLKLVTHCRSSSSGDPDVLLEYAAYKLYAMLTPASFSARLVTIDYRDPSGKVIANRPAFFIEDVKDVARRNGLAEAHGGTRVPLAALSPPAAARYALFEHMIANHDWSMRAGPAGEDCCHNAKLIGGLGAGQAIPVPYDFDFSGLVDAPYAYPPEQLNIDSVKVRKYRGYCAHNAAVIEAAHEFRARQPALLAELSNIPGLAGRDSAKAASFLQPFFADIATDASVQSRVLSNCVR